MEATVVAIVLIDDDEPYLFVYPGRLSREQAMAEVAADAASDEKIKVRPDAEHINGATVQHIEINDPW